jgi:allantoinase
VAALWMVLRLCDEYRCPVHVVHLAAAEAAAEVIAETRRCGLPATFETCPHYLYFTAEDVPDGDPRYKCAPPIRGRADNARLWRMLFTRGLDTIGSDHSPAPPELKHLDTGDLRRAWGGIASLQLLLPAVWTAAARQNWEVPVERGIAKMTSAPAAVAGLAGRKGAIAKGMDADLVVFDADREFVVTPEALHHRHKATPYLGHQLRGVVETTYLRGRKVYDRGEFVGGPTGQLLERPLTGPKRTWVRSNG